MPGERPAPLTPDLASTTTSEPTTPAATAGGAGQAGEGDVDGAGVGLIPELAFQLVEREDLRVGLAREGPRGELDQLDARVAGEEVDQRHARVPVGPRDGGLDPDRGRRHGRMNIQVDRIFMRNEPESERPPAGPCQLPPRTT